MKTVFEHLRYHIYATKNLLPPPAAKFDFKSLQKTEWSSEFEQLCRNRLIMAALRYGLLEEKKRSGSKWDLLGAITEKIKLYSQTGNTEYLVDAANYCQLEFVCGQHPNKHFHALDDHHNHCKLKSHKK